MFLMSFSTYVIFIPSSDLCLKIKQFDGSSATAIFKITNGFLSNDSQESFGVKESTKPIGRNAISTLEIKQNKVLKIL